MSTVRSSSTTARRQPRDWSMTLAKIGVWLAIGCFGGIIWAVNGGFSVIGLGVVASSFNEAGRLFWAAASAIRFPVPVAVPGLPATQPLIPWLGVLAASILQIVVIYRKLRNLDIPPWLWAAATALSLYDLTTTFFGLGTVAWLAAVGWPIQAVLALVLTFAVEGIIGYLLRR
jgi:hypothetical protein